jgi:hypothetical protein
MRLVELLRPYIGDLERLIDLTPSKVDMRPHLLLPDGIAYEAADAAQAAVDQGVGRGSMAMIALGPDRDLYGDPDHALAVLARLGPGGRALVLFGWEPAELPYRRLLEPLTRDRGQVLQAAGIDHPPIRAGAIVERVEALTPPRDATGQPVAPPPQDASERLALEIRLANEWVFADLVASGMRKDGDRSAGENSQGQADQERVRWQRQINERDARIQRLEAAVAHLEDSGSLRVGRAIVSAGRSPVLAARLPIDLYRIWRRRDHERG